MEKQTNRMRAAASLLVVGLLVTGCSFGTDNNEVSPKKSLLEAPWEDIQAQAKGQTVNLYMWGGSESINRYMDEWVAPRLQAETDVTLHRVPMNDTKDILNKLLTEKQAGRTAGSMDVIWINGENFKTAKDHGLLYGSFSGNLPNVKQYVDQDAPDIQNDFGLATDGLEAPWGKAQFVFVYDSAKISEPPKSMVELKDWVKKHPGKFTYPAPPDFTGSAFVRQALYETTGGYQNFLQPFEKSDVEKQAQPLWSFLNEIEPNLWRNGETYPENLAKLDQLYASGEVWMTMGYDPARASNQIEQGTFRDTTRTFVLEDGTLANTHYLAIPFNAQNPAAAMAAINFLLSPDAQIAKYDPQHWGEDMALDPNKLSAQDQERLNKIDRGVATLPSDVLTDHRLPELQGEYVSYLDQGWFEHVAKH